VRPRQKRILKITLGRKRWEGEDLEGDLEKDPEGEGGTAEVVREGDLATVSEKETGSRWFKIHQVK
jgi:hypothetical protein